MEWETRHSTPLGRITVRDGIPSSYGEFKTFADYQVIYPLSVVTAIQELCKEYHTVFSKSVRAHTEASTDYQLLLMDNQTNYINLFVQVDMAGLSTDFIETTKHLDVYTVKELISGRVFEIDDSLAMYNLMRGIHSGYKPSAFKMNFDAALTEVRNRAARPIAILATTTEKYHAIMQTELGIMDGSIPSTEYVQNTIGFDKVFGPEEFKEHLATNDGKSLYLLYVRASPPVHTLKNADVESSELLTNHEYRRIIRANALTINIDNPQADSMGLTIVNDSKASLPDMGMGFRINTTADIRTKEFIKWNKRVGIDLATPVRAKPVYGAHGAHGAFTTRIQTMAKPESKLEKAIEKWGAYLIQPEIKATEIHNTTNAITYGFVDRLFVYSRPDGSTEFLGGLRNFIPTSSHEAKKNNYHGNSDAVWGEIIGPVSCA